MKRRTLLPSAAVGLGLTLAACGYLGGEVQPYRPPAYYLPPEQATGGAELVESGRHLYLRDCAFCHGSDGRGTERGTSVVDDSNGPALWNFMLRTGRMPIDAPREQTTRSEPVYSPEEIRAIVLYMASALPAPGPDIPRVELRRGDLAEGQQLYQEHCAACHATTGIGGAMLTQRGRESIGGTAGIIIPDLSESSALDIAEAVRTGPGTMPVFPPTIISDEGLNSLVRYSLYLKDPRDEGGAPIGHVGPVVEGAVGWGLGLGVLIVVIRWMGTKAGERE